MKKYLGLGVIIIFFFYSCDKWVNCSEPNPELSTSTWIYVDSCKNMPINNVNISICFDSLLSDNRCPIGAACPIGGAAIARFKASINNQIHLFKLGTTNFNNAKKDTTINGYTIMLDSILPHPAINNVYPYKSYKAKLIITN